jgi:hypothetical protein
VTVEPASAVPVIVGVRLVCAFAIGLVMTGVPGACVSIVNGTAVELGLVPLPSVAVAVAECAPMDSGVVGVHAKAPLAFAAVMQVGVVLPSR